MTISQRREFIKWKRRVKAPTALVIKRLGRVRVRAKRTLLATASIAPAFYTGWQEGPTATTGFPLYTLTQAIPGHVQWSTVSGNTLINAGFMLPPGHTGGKHARSQSVYLHNAEESTRTAA